MAEIFEPYTGVYKGKLTEDMIETVKRTHQLYCSVLVEDFYTDDSLDTMPLTRVPLWATVLPLKKDDEVYVYFDQSNSLYPVLYKCKELTADNYEDFQLPSSTSLVTIPSSESTAEVTQLSSDYWIITTDKYTVLHKGNNFYLLGEDGQIIYTTTLQIKADKIIIEPGKDKLNIANSTVSLGKVLSGILNALTNIMTPASFTAPNGPCNYLHPEDLTNITLLKFQLKTLLEGVE